MSRPRSRPTREETRDRLLRAAARMFSSKGIGSTSIEDICDEAGFSRGAFYSNFGAKDELIIELIDVHMASSSNEMDRLWSTSASAIDFVENLESDRRQRTSPIETEDNNVLYIELLLYAMRTPENRPRLVEHHRRQRASNRKVLEQIVAAVGRDYPAPLDDLVSLIMAIDTGLGFNYALDPASYRPNMFTDFMTLLHQLWLASPPDAFDPPNEPTAQ